MRCVYAQNDGVTALHISVMTGDEAMVKLLHSFKASASIPDKVSATNVVVMVTVTFIIAVTTF